MQNYIEPQRDQYVDFLRGLGLLMLIVAHCWAPSWINRLRGFDVPLMVFVSAICYKPLMGGYLAYSVKRFKRIYIPVFVFLTLLFGVEAGLNMLFGTSMPHYKSIIGSYLLLYKPSIGFLWIMRVFLMMALLTPVLHVMLKRAGVAVSVLTTAAIIILQSLLASGVMEIAGETLRFIVAETLLYAVGYSAIVVLGLKIREFNVKSLAATALLCSVAVIGFIIYNDVAFDPRMYKYPPQSLYLLYGVLGCSSMMLLKPCFARISGWRGFRYLSENSMWIYLWHIVPVMFIEQYADVPGMWFGRYVAVLVSAIAMNWLWHLLLKPLPARVKRYLA